MQIFIHLLARFVIGDFEKLEIQHSREVIYHVFDVIRRKYLKFYFIILFIFQEGIKSWENQMNYWLHRDFWRYRDCCDEIKLDKWTSEFMLGMVMPYKSGQTRVEREWVRRERERVSVWGCVCERERETETQTERERERLWGRWEERDSERETRRERRNCWWIWWTNLEGLYIMGRYIFLTDLPNSPPPPPIITNYHLNH